MQLTGPENDPSNRFVRTVSITVPSKMRYILSALAEARASWGLLLSCDSSVTLYSLLGNGSDALGFWIGTAARALASALGSFKPLERSAVREFAPCIVARAE